MTLSKLHSAAIAALAFAVSTGFSPSAVASASAVDEPPWPGVCPVEVGLLVDRSSSMEAGFGDVRSASSDLVDAFRGQPTRVLLIGFGTTAQVVHPLTDVSDGSGRAAVKEAIAALEARSKDDADSGTNWDAALRLASDHGARVVIVLTDGAPTVFGDPAQAPADTSDPAPLQAAVATADALKSSGVRVVPVGIGVEDAAVGNLAAISGPVQGEDYFAGDLAGLRRELYEVASRSCGVPVAALPTPEPAGFPVAAVLTAGGAALGVVLLVGLLLARRRSGPASAAPSPVGARSRRVQAPRPIQLEDVAPPTLGAPGRRPPPAGPGARDASDRLDGQF